MIQAYLPPLIIAAIITGGLTYYVKKIAFKLNAVDLPSPRKIHPKPVPRLGGLAMVGGFLFLLIGYSLASPRLGFSINKIWFMDSYLFGAILGMFVLLVLGYLDDRRGIKAWKKLFWQIIAASIAVGFGASINYIRLPGGLHANFDQLVLPLSIFGLHFNFVVWADILTVFWIVLMINTLNFLDGLDGLASGISAIAGIVIFFLSISLGQDANALLSLLFTGVVLGFLPWNFNPAKIFMGDTGSMFLGYTLGILSVISGGKLETAFLVLGIPLLDVGWVILRRIMSGHSPFEADKLHLHHRLLTSGLNQKQAVILLYLVSAFFGAIAILNTTDKKIQAIWWLVGLMLALIVAMLVLECRKRRKN